VPEDSNVEAWDAIAESYQRDHLISLEDIHYGPLCPGEKELQLLGDIEGKHILDVGCGGGQNTFVLAKWGARVVALDPSRAQLAYARKICQELRDRIDFIQGRAKELTAFRKETFDIVFSSLSLDFVENVGEFFRQVRRVLRPQGLLVFSVIHPFMNCVGWYLMSDRDAPEVENYYEMRGVRHSFWDFEDGTRGRLYHFRHTLEELFTLVVEQGFRITALREPRPYDLELLGKDNWDKIPYGYRDFDMRSMFFQVMQTLPYTLVIQAVKEEGERE